MCDTRGGILACSYLSSSLNLFCGGTYIHTHPNSFLVFVFVPSFSSIRCRHLLFVATSPSSSLHLRLRFVFIAVVVLFVLVRLLYSRPQIFLHTVRCGANSSTCYGPFKYSHLGGVLTFPPKVAGLMLLIVRRIVNEDLKTKLN